MSEQVPSKDLVSRLREARAFLVDGGVPDKFSGSLYEEAADEIERLQRELTPKVCCGDFDHCRERCIPLVDEWRRRATHEPPAALTDEQIRALTRKFGGDFHGPKVEHVSMEEQAYFRMIRSLSGLGYLTAGVAELRDALRTAQPPAVDELGSVRDPDAVVRQLLQSYFWLKTLRPNTRYARLQDDHDGKHEGWLSVTIGEDGDAWVSLDTDARFRMPGTGGGRSDYTRTALVILAEAIRRDNAERPPRPTSTKAGE